ncbi:hypothetical protein [Enterococcus silesiacus]|nr:hypothetical protein [Enterococcus silesiacus]
MNKIRSADKGRVKFAFICAFLDFYSKRLRLEKCGHYLQGRRVG